jgi:hypothetical protein
MQREGNMMTEPRTEAEGPTNAAEPTEQSPAQASDQGQVPGHESEEPTLWWLLTERTAQACPARFASNAAERLRNGIMHAARFKLEAELAAQDTYGVPVDPSIRSKLCSTGSPWLGLRNAGRARLVKRGQPLAA